MRLTAIIPKDRLLGSNYIGCGKEVVIYKILSVLLMSELNKYGICFWAGGGIYSLINLILNYKRVAQSEVLLYNYLILGVAIIGLILNIVLLKRIKIS